MSLLRVAILGAESTGKSSLIQSLSNELTRIGYEVRVVDEFLREWCAREGRTPKAHEQAAIAHEQARRLQAALHPATRNVSVVVLSDTSPLMTAIYSDVLFADRSLLNFGLAQQKDFDITLVTGLDLPWVADGVQRDGKDSQVPIDRRLRESLLHGSIAFQVIYGMGPQRTHNALKLLLQRLGCLPPAPERQAWSCDNCSDASCEHRLFTRLVKNRL